MTAFNKMIHFIEKTRRWLQKGERKDIFFWGVIVLSMALIGESIWIGDYLSRQKNGQKAAAATVTPQPRPVLVLQGKSKMKADAEATVQLILQGKQTVNVRGLDVVLGYDPKAMAIVDSDPKTAGAQVEIKNKFLGQVARNLVDERRGRIFLSWLNFDRVGAAVMPGDEIVLANLHFKLKSQNPESLKLHFLKGTQAVDIEEKAVPLQTKDFSVMVK